MTSAAAPTEATGSRSAPAKGGRSAVFLSLFWDIGLSLVAFYGMRLLGFDPYTALWTGTIVAGLRTLYVAVKARKLDVFAVFMAGTFGISLGLSFLTGDARFLLAKDSIGTSLIGLVFLVTCLFGKPMIFHLIRRFRSSSVQMQLDWDQRWETEPPVRHTFRVLSVGWGIVLLVEALVRIPLIYLLPIDVMAGISPVFSLFFIGPLLLWSVWYGKRRHTMRLAAA
jgi:intracellular septation protein A